MPERLLTISDDETFLSFIELKCNDNIGSYERLEMSAWINNLKKFTKTEEAQDMHPV